MADDVVTSVVSSVGQWTFRTALIIFFLALMGATYYLYNQNTKLYDKIVEITLERAECKAELKALKEMRK